MLLSLSIHNVVLIDKAEIAFAPGLCVLSGETGSGKSILLDALGLALGFRANFRLIGSDENKAQVAAEFDISQNQICKNILAENDLLDVVSPDLLRIRRSLHENSVNKIFANDVAIGVNLLAKIGESLVEIHGQHDQRGLLNPGQHLSILDEFAGNENLLKSLRKIYENLRAVEEKISELKAKKEAAERERDYLEHVIRELENADLKTGEEDELIAKKDLLLGREKILRFASDLRLHLTEANSQLISAQKILIRNQNLSENLSDISEKIDQQNSELDSAISSVDELVGKISGEENSLETIEERIFFIRSLARKYSTPLDSMSELINDSKEKLKLISNEEEVARELENQRLTLNKDYKKIAEELSTLRQESARLLSAKTEEELKFLKMGEVKFHAELTPCPLPLNPSGFERTRFLASLNKNKLDDISKIASGGELSRFMLALKVALLGVKSVPTMIFDEIDTGIGGGTADAVGKRLKTLAEKLQILVVTHQPQIAAKADTHFKVSKTAVGKIKTKIEKLDHAAQTQEIARMLSGEEISAEAVSAAKSLLAQT
ncbi:MAG: DNA repair protein RecN [Alphaproteobacteria bacterium]|nr:DNA repair protein RecN [Alphaproteobacteria bacterium]